MKRIVLVVLALSAVLPGQALAQPDRTTSGGDVHVRAGETVRDVATMGGDAVIEGHVEGDVFTMGGDVVVRGEVDQDVVTMGGDIEVADGARVGGEMVTMGGDVDVAEGAATGGARIHIGEHTDFTPGFITPATGLLGVVGDALFGLLSFGLLFLLGLILLGATPDRLGALQSVIIREPLRAGATGLLAMLGAILAIVVLAITIVGIPVAVVVSIGLPIAGYVGMVAAATVLGAALPFAKLKDRPILQLAAGVGALYIASLIPFAGTVILVAAASVGLGAMVITKLKPVSPVATGFGPYR